MNKITIDYCCPICCAFNKITVHSEVPPTYDDPGAPTEYDPTSCGICDTMFIDDTILELASEEWDRRRDEAADYKNEERRDERP